VDILGRWFDPVTGLAFCVERSEGNTLIVTNDDDEIGIAHDAASIRRLIDELCLKRSSRR
jgi:hypothetical protein